MAREGMRMASRALPLLMISLASAGSAWAAGDVTSGVDVQRGYVGLYSRTCWNAAFAGPDYRTAKLLASADARFEKPSAVLLAAAKRRVVTVYVWPDSAMDCGNEVPEAVVIRDAADTNTLKRLPLTVKTDLRSNAFGASAFFGEGAASLTFAEFKALFPGERVVYLITSAGRRGAWRLDKEMRSVDDPDAWTQAQLVERRDSFVDRFNSACDKESVSKDPAWLNLDIVRAAIETPSDGVARDVSLRYIPCLERLAAEGDPLVKTSAQRLLSAVRGIAP
jgi:hypothetical protein